MNERRRLVSRTDLMLVAANQKPPVDPVKTLKRSGIVTVIAEIKRASPSKGAINPDLDLVKMAKDYEYAGAGMISVLTESTQFKGSLTDLKTVCANVNVPVLRKDFIVDEYQILEARAAGASCVLLIQRVFEWGKNGGYDHMQKLIAYTHSLGMRVLLECHNLDEVKTSKSLDVKMVGINTRDLSDFSVNREEFAMLNGVLASDAVRIAESGVGSINDFRDYCLAGADAVLVGEMLVRSEDTVATIREMLFTGADVKGMLAQEAGDDDSDDTDDAGEDHIGISEAEADSAGISGAAGIDSVGTNSDGAKQADANATDYANPHAQHNITQEFARTTPHEYADSSVNSGENRTVDGAENRATSSKSTVVSDYEGKTNQNSSADSDTFQTFAPLSEVINAEYDKESEIKDKNPAGRLLSELTGPYFGRFGGVFVPEALIAALDEFEAGYNRLKDEPDFINEYKRLLKDYVGRPSALTEVPRFAADIALKIYEQTGKYITPKVYLKREDLNHTGAHKINNALGQALIAKSIGKTRVVAETGAGQHGVATATVCALLGLDCVIYMGEVDCQRQALNVARMKLLGADVVSVKSGNAILKDAINEALRDWVTNVENTHYLLGTVCGPHPYPQIGRDFQKIIGEEAKSQLFEKSPNRPLPDAVIACVGGGSNAIGIFNAFLDEKSVKLYGVEAGGEGVHTGKHAVRFSDEMDMLSRQANVGTEGVFQGAYSYLLQDSDGQTLETHSISAGLDYASIGPEHPYLREIKRVTYLSATDAMAMDAFSSLCKTEGIIPALESSHALAGAYSVAKEFAELDILSPTLLINLSGRGDKDVVTAGKYFGILDDGGLSGGAL